MGLVEHSLIQISTILRLMPRFLFILFYFFRPPVELLRYAFFFFFISNAATFGYFQPAFFFFLYILGCVSIHIPYLFIFFSFNDERHMAMQCKQCINAYVSFYHTCNTEYIWSLRGTVHTGGYCLYMGLG